MPATTTISACREANSAEPAPAKSRPIIRVAVFAASPPATGLIQELLAETDWCSCRLVENGEAEDESLFLDIDAAVLIAATDQAADTGVRQEAWQERLMELLRRHRVGAMVISPQPWRFADYGFGTVALPPDTPLDMVHGVLLALSRARPVMLLMDKQVENIRRLSEMLSRQYNETQNDLRLAARLQGDFLPRELPEIGPLRFATLYRPSAWVSGDIFDIFRLDERHWGFYIADVVGHGVAAGLLTVYIKQVIQAKRIFKDSYELVSPAEVLSSLNEHIAARELRDSQFATGWYGLINVETLELKYAVAGHPPVLLIQPGGGSRELRGEGCILGLGVGQQFTTESVYLTPGDRLLAYTDGLESVLIADRPPWPRAPVLADKVQELLHLPAKELIARLGDSLDTTPGSLTRADDASAIVIDVL